MFYALTKYYIASLDSPIVLFFQCAIISTGLPVDELKKKLPQSVDLVCLNNPDNCTISGPKTDVENFVRQLQKENVFARIVGSGGVPFHGRYVQTAKDTLLKYMKTVNYYFIYSVFVIHLRILINAE